MKILALNSGSSSVKYELYDCEKKKTISKGTVERIGIDGSFINYSIHDEKIKENFICNNQIAAVNKIITIISDKNNRLLNDIEDLRAVSHRITHGGSFYHNSVFINDEVYNNIESLTKFAPLHIPHNLSGIKAVKEFLPNLPQIAVFDTAFHQTMPEHAYRYSIAKKWYEQHGIRRFGYHGTSHLYVSRRAAVVMNKKHTDTNLITLHIGNGASAAAIKNGKSIDTSLGFGTLDGIIMGTRPGALDPTIPLYMMEEKNLSISDTYNELYKNSGVLGITGKYTDRRDVMDAANKGDKDSKLALDMEAYYLKKHIGMYLAVLGRVDAIVFTAGVGENSPYARKTALEGLENLGIILDHDINEKTTSSSGETLISTKDSKIKVYMIPTNEELIFIEDAIGLLEGTYTNTNDYIYSFQK